MKGRINAKFKGSKYIRMDGKKKEGTFSLFKWIAKKTEKRKQLYGLLECVIIWYSCSKACDQWYSIWLKYEESSLIISNIQH